MSNTGTAIFSKCGKYRYKLTRTISESNKRCVFIMLNPSTADADKDDKTITRCIRYAKRWSCGKLIVVNIFAYKTTKPKYLYTAVDPVGPDNHKHIINAVNEVVLPDIDYDNRNGLVICGWGTHGKYLEQGETVLGWLLDTGYVEPMCLAITKDGHPGHPLFLKKILDPIPYKGTK